MNVLHATIATEWAGVATHLYTLLPKLQQKGINVFFVSFGDSLLCERLSGRGIIVKIIERNRKLDIMAVRQLAKYIDMKSIDIIHMHGYMAIIYGCFASLLCKHKKLAVTLHQPSQTFTEITNRRFKYSLKFAYNFAKLLGARFIAVSKDVEESYLNNYNFPRRNVELIYNGIDLQSEEMISARPIYKDSIGIPKNSKIISIIGRLEDIKGHCYFIEAAKQIISRHKEIIFLIIGDGSQKKNIERLTKKLKIDNNIKILGFQKDILGFLLISDILVISSLFEGIPYILLEAMALGVNIIATNTGGLKEVLNNYSEGILVRSRSSEEIHEAVLELLSNKDMMLSLKDNAKKRVKELFNADIMTKNTIGLYKEMLGREYE